MTDNEEIWPAFALISATSFVMIILGYVINPMFLTFAGAPFALFVETMVASIGMILFLNPIDFTVPAFGAGVVFFAIAGVMGGVVAIVDWLYQRGDGS